MSAGRKLRSQEQLGTGPPARELHTLVHTRRRGTVFSRQWNQGRGGCPPLCFCARVFTRRLQLQARLLSAELLDGAIAVAQFDSLRRD
jgi:hypothetical protein